MFTGIVEEVGTLEKVIQRNKGKEFTINAKRILEDCKIEDSVAVNGVCLTVTNILSGSFVVHAVSETLSRTTLGNIKQGTKVNLERALTLNKRLGGHIVQGHVDFTSKIISIKKDGESHIVEISISNTYLKYIVEKGSVTVNGVSLTVADLYNSSFKIAVIPFTWENTVFLLLKPGEYVNIELDIIAKYVERLMSDNQRKTGNLSFDKLRSLGF